MFEEMNEWMKRKVDNVLYRKLRETAKGANVSCIQQIKKMWQVLWNLWSYGSGNGPNCNFTSVFFIGHYSELLLLPFYGLWSVVSAFSFFTFCDLRVLTHFLFIFLNLRIFFFFHGVFSLMVQIIFARSFTIVLVISCNW